MMRVCVLVLGVLAALVAWTLPLPALLPGPFAAHMVMHMAVVAVAAPVVALAVAGGRFDPVRRWPSAFPPVPLSVLELVAVWAFHTPWLHRVARTTTAGLVVEQGTFLLGGVLVWLAAFGGGATRRTDRAGAGVVALLLTSMHMTLLGALLALAPRPLFHHRAATTPLAATGLDPLADQQLGGAIMLLAGGVVYLAGGVWLTHALLRQRSGRPAAVAPATGPVAERSRA